MADVKSAQLRETLGGDPLENREVVLEDRVGHRPVEDQLGDTELPVPARPVDERVQRGERLLRRGPLEQHLLQRRHLPALRLARGIPITCANCGARRDWLLLSVRHQVFVRCRCAHEWREPDLETGDFDSAYSGPEREWDDFDQMYRGLGFDGLLSGVIWAD